MLVLHKLSGDTDRARTACMLQMWLRLALLKSERSELMGTDDKSNADYWNLKGLTLGKDSRFEDAIGCFDRAIQLDGGHFRA